MAFQSVSDWAKSNNITPGKDNSLQGNINSAVSQVTPTTPATPDPSLADNTANAELEGGNAMISSAETGANNYSAGVNQANSGTNIWEQAKGELNATGGLLGSGMGVAAGALQTLFAGVTGAVKSTGNAIGNLPIVQQIANSGFGDAVNSGEQGLNNWTQAHPDLSKHLSDALTVGLASLGGGEDITKIPDTVKNDLGNIKDFVGSPSASPNGVDPLAQALTPDQAKTQLNSRIQDATPAYNKDMAINRTKVTTAEGNTVPQVVEGHGLTPRTVVPSAANTEAGTEMANIKDYPENGTALEKSQAVDKANTAEAESMRAGLQAEDKANPLNTDTEKIKVSNMVKQNLPENIQSKVGSLSPEDEQYVRGMNDKAGAPEPEGGKYDLRSPQEKASGTKFEKTPTGRYYQKVLDAVNDYDGTREGKLDLRQKIDSAYKSEGGKYAYGTDSQTALQESHTDIRNSVNQDLADSTTNTDTKASLKRQTNLYRGAETLGNKAGAESNTAFGRLEQKYPSLRMGVRLLQREGIRIPLEAAGVTGLGYAMYKAINKK